MPESPDSDGGSPLQGTAAPPQLEAPKPRPRRRKTRIAPASVRPHAIARQIAIVALGTLAVAAIVKLGAAIRDSAYEAAATGKNYVFAFREIQLEPEPPAWIKLGASGLLEAIRTSAHRPETESIATLDLERLSQDIAANPWVAKVNHADKRFPNRVRVKVEYREPVAVAKTPQGPVYLDAIGVVLPAAELAPKRSGPLFLLQVGEAIPPLRAGVRWGMAPMPDGETAPDSRITSACELAKALKSLGANRPERDSRLQVVALHPHHPSGLFVELGGEIMVLWGKTAGAPEAIKQKWEILEDWVDHGGPATLVRRRKEYLEFRGKALVIHRPKSG